MDSFLTDTYQILELLTTLILLVALIFAISIHFKYPKLSAKSWLTICYGLFFLVIHALFDLLDSHDWETEILSDYFNIVDGITYIIGLLLIALGIVKISKKGQEIWGN